MSERLYIAVPVYNRVELATLCVPTIRAGMADGDKLIIYDDGSTEPLSKELEAAANGIDRRQSIGIDAQRRNHIMEFYRAREIHGCDTLYLADSDAIHDPSWRSSLLALQEKYKAPICGYRTKTHEDYKNNVYRDDASEDVIWQRFAPGVSYLLTMEHCEKLAFHMPDRMAWDWWAPSVLGYKMAISRVSYCDHVGFQGMHDLQTKPGYVSKERALNPTDALVRMRSEVLEKLQLKDEIL